MTKRVKYKGQMRTKREIALMKAKANSPTPATDAYVCPRCKDVFPLEKFYNTKKRKVGKICSRCLSKQRATTHPKKPSRRDTYLPYLSSTEWQDKRREYWESGAYRFCYVCEDPWIGFKGKDLHHRSYKNFGQEELDDLVPVCRPCHKDITQLWAEIRKETKKISLWSVTDAVALLYIYENV